MKRRASFPVLVLGLLAPGPAHAHLMQTGFGPFYDGLMHLFVTPQDLLPIIALALIAGLRGARFGRGVLFALPLAWLAGSVLGSLLSPPVPPALPTAIAIIALGLVAVLDRPLPLAAVVTLAIGLGLLNGSFNGAELARVHGGMLVAMGNACAIFFAVAVLAGQVATLRTTGARIAVRAAASWIAASGLLMLGWSLRGG